MAIHQQEDSDASATGTSISFTHTFTLSDPQFVFAGLCQFDVTLVPDLATATYGGVDMTLLVTAGNVHTRSTIFFLLAPPTGSPQTVTMTWTNSASARASVTTFDDNSNSAILSPGFTDPETGSATGYQNIWFPEAQGLAYEVGTNFGTQTPTGTPTVFDIVEESHFRLGRQVLLGGGFQRIYGYSNTPFTVSEFAFCYGALQEFDAVDLDPIEFDPIGGYNSPFSLFQEPYSLTKAGVAIDQQIRRTRFI